MPQLSNPRHETFCANRANGLGVFDAYISAGFEGNPTAATQIEKRPEVKQRVTELIAERQQARTAAQRDEDDSVSDLDKQWVLRELKKNVQEAQKTGQISASNKAIELIMDIVGLTPKRGAPPPEEEKKPGAAPSDDKLDNVLGKLEQMSGFAAQAADGEA